jgi:Ulp1 family protease
LELTPKGQVTRRRQSDASNHDNLTLLRPSNFSARRETRSRTALLKNHPYCTLKCDADRRILEYPNAAAKKKITLYMDDLARLEDDEFLNDTIIEFYLMYSISIKRNSK